MLRDVDMHHSPLDQASGAGLALLLQGNHMALHRPTETRANTPFILFSLVSRPYKIILTCFRRLLLQHDAKVW